MRKGTTKSGFYYEFDETRLDDMRFVDVLAKVLDEKNRFDQIAATSKLITMLLGEELKEKLYEHIGAQFENGRVPQEVFKQYVEEIMANSEIAEEELKN